MSQSAGTSPASAAASSAAGAAFSLRLVEADFQMREPLPGYDPVRSPLTGSAVQRAPVLRLWGIAKEGQKACMSVHGVFPYFLAPWPPTKALPSRDELRALAAAIETAVNETAMKEGGPGPGGGSGKMRQHVFDIVVEQHVPFYGFHTAARPYLKVFLYNPWQKKKIAQILHAGAVMGCMFQQHEAHVPYLLHFLIDYNIHGMNFVDVAETRFRLPLPDEGYWRQGGVSVRQLCDAALERETTCSLELEVRACDILNRKRGSGSPGQPSNPGLQALWEDEKFRRRQRGQASQLTHAASAGRAAGATPTENQGYFDLLLASAGERDRALYQGSQAAASEGAEPPPFASQASSTTGTQSQAMDALAEMFGEEEEEEVGRGAGRDGEAGLDGARDAEEDDSELDETLLMSQVWHGGDAAIMEEVAESVDDFPAEPSQELAASKEGMQLGNDHPARAEGGEGHTGAALAPATPRHTLVGLAEQTSAQATPIRPRRSSLASSQDATRPPSSSRRTSKGRRVSFMDTVGSGVSPEAGSNPLLLAEEVPNTPPSQLRKGRRVQHPADRDGTELGEAEASIASEPAVLDPLPDGQADWEMDLDSELPLLSFGDHSVDPLLQANVLYQLAFPSPPQSPPQIIDHPRPGSPSLPRPRPRPLPPPRLDVPEGRSGGGGHSDGNQTPDQVTGLRATDSPLRPSQSPMVSSWPSKSLLLFDDKQPSAPSSGGARSAAHLSFPGPDCDGSSSERSGHLAPGKSPWPAAQHGLVRFAQRPPSLQQLDGSAADLGIPLQVHQLAFYGNASDAGGAARTLAGETLTIRPKTTARLRDFHAGRADHTGLSAQQRQQPTLLGQTQRWQTLTPARRPPTCQAVERYIQDKLATAAAATAASACSGVSGASGVSAASTSAPSGNKPHGSSSLNFTMEKSTVSQIDGPTLRNTYNFRVKAQNVSAMAARHECQFLTMVSMELHATSRVHAVSGADLLPDPQHDAIQAIFFSIKDEAFTLETGLYDRKWILTCVRGKPFDKQGLTDYEIVDCASEAGMLEEFVAIIQRLDPEVLVGWEVQQSSWGYLLQRGDVLKLDLVAALSRTPGEESHRRKDKYGARHSSELRLTGRIILNVWRLIRHEATLTQYTYEHCAYHVLHKRVPWFSYSTLKRWFTQRWRVVRHYMERARGCFQLLDELNFVERTSEFARLFGILFSEVISRGSQFRVESIMLRLAKADDFVAFSPTRVQVRNMNAAESLPLILEPESKFYTDPVLVLDFQSLYPSMIIAYNMCFSTCLGKIPSAEQQETGMAVKFGVSAMNLPAGLLSDLYDQGQLHVAPTGTLFCKPETREGILPRMLDEILKTRVMVKQSMKNKASSNPALARLLNARQLGLKLLANVTYGYTSASFSGRMPCVDIADSIVQQARETLQQAINIVNQHPKWGAKVVYGDTDSLFVHLKGVSKDEAFRIGREICDHITAINPDPVKLKFEKVYLPCMLQTKKRYVGFMYETPDQKEPEFDAKGIETVRRDVCPAVAKIMEKALKHLFVDRDVSIVKSYFQSQCRKILLGRVNTADFVFAKEYRGRDSYSTKACVAALEIAKKLTARDPRAEPRVRERVPYVIVCGSPKSTLISLVRMPEELLEDPALRLNATYYIHKAIIPPLNRCFGLLGIDVSKWYNELPRMMRCATPALQPPVGRRATISQFYQSRHCLVCDALTTSSICEACAGDAQRTAVSVAMRLRGWEKRSITLGRICQRCCAKNDVVECGSLACPVFFERHRVQRKLEGIASVAHLAVPPPSALDW